MSSAVKNYFAITKKQWNGMLVLIALMLIVLIAPDVYQLLKKPDVADFSRIKEAQQTLNLAEEKSDYEYKNYTAKPLSGASFSRIKSKPVYFSFNPNQLDIASWKKLGLSERQINVIKNYESKGGRFYHKEDLQKVYSITPEDYNRLMPYIDIPEKIYAKGFIKDKPVFKSKVMAMVEINQADSAQLTTIKGVGPAFASRILKYRNRLGGFYRKMQLMEVYGLDSAKYEEVANQITIDVAGIIKININKVEFDDLKHNPYLSFKQMNAIIQYRKQHGNFKNIDDLKSVAILNDEIIHKLEPYFTY